MIFRQILTKYENGKIGDFFFFENNLTSCFFFTFLKYQNIACKYSNAISETENNSEDQLITSHECARLQCYICRKF